MENTQVITFDPEVNAAIFRCFELVQNMNRIVESQEQILVDNPDFRQALYNSLKEEKDYIYNELLKMFKAIPDFDENSFEEFVNFNEGGDSAE